MFINLPYFYFIFANIACLILCGIDSAHLAFAVVIPSSHNIAASLCCNVDHFIPEVTILRYNYKLTLNTIIRKQFVVGIYKT
jgi:hypothetical protein